MGPSQRVHVNVGRRAIEWALVIFPTYNESENLPRLIPAVLEKDERIEILIVDDASPDGTGEVADQIASEEPRVHTLHRPGKLGLGTAYLTGLDRKSTRLNSSHVAISYAVFCLKKKNTE